MWCEEANSKFQCWSFKGINIVKDLWVKDTWDWISLSNLHLNEITSTKPISSIFIGFNSMAHGKWYFHNSWIMVST